MDEPRKLSERAGYETRDVRTRWVAVGGAAVFGSLAIVLMLTWMVVRMVGDELPPPRTPQVRSGEFPAPQLQVNALADLQNLQDYNDRILKNYRWVDRNQGVVAIPIERAMESVAERGIPDFKGPVTAPREVRQ